MSQKKHQKHAKLAKPSIGNFGRNEFSFVGTSCGLIKNLCATIIDTLHQKYKITYIDADHAENNENPVELKNAFFIDKITYKRLDIQEVNSFQQKFLLNNQDLILVNGNHFEANKQFVFIDTKKETSLKKRIAQLTNIQAFILLDDSTEIFPFLKESIPNWAEIPVFKLNESEKIIQKIEVSYIIPPLKGLVLAGGKSTRMGIDKGTINYHGIAQREYVYELMNMVCQETYISCRTEQAHEIELPIITDKFSDLGVYGAILSAFQHDPNAAWLIVACDLPLLGIQSLQFLKENRAISKTATAFYNPETQFPDPLLTIYEPKAYQALLQFLGLGYSCPRKVLINSDTHIIQPNSSQILANANTPEEAEKIKAYLKKIS